MEPLELPPENLGSATTQKSVELMRQLGSGFLLKHFFLGFHSRMDRLGLFETIPQKTYIMVKDVKACQSLFSILIWSF